MNDFSRVEIKGKQLKYVGISRNLAIPEEVFSSFAVDNVDKCCLLV